MADKLNSNKYETQIPISDLHPTTKFKLKPRTLSMPNYWPTPSTASELKKLRKDPVWVQGQQTKAKAKDRGFWIENGTTLKGCAADREGTIRFSDLDQCFRMSGTNITQLEVLTEPSFDGNLSDKIKAGKLSLVISPPPGVSFMKQTGEKLLHYLVSSVYVKEWFFDSIGGGNEQCVIDLDEYITRDDGRLAFTYQYVSVFRLIDFETRSNLFSDTKWHVPEIIVTTTSALDNKMKRTSSEELSKVYLPKDIRSKAPPSINLTTFNTSGTAKS